MDAKKRFKRRQRDEAAASDENDHKQRQLDDILKSGGDSETIRNARSEADAAQKKSDEASRKAAKAKARLEYRVQELKRLGVVPEEEHIQDSGVSSASPDK